MPPSSPAVPLAVVVRIVALVILLAIGGAFSHATFDAQRAEGPLPDAPVQYDPVQTDAVAGDFATWARGIPQ